MSAGARVAIFACLTLLALPDSTLRAQKSNKEKYYPGKPGVYDQLVKAPAKAAKRSNPLENDPDAVPGGAKLYDQHCAECHGELAEGSGKKVSD